MASIFSSQGDLEARFPVSLAESRNILYVLNAGDRGSLTGFRVRGNCTLVPLAQSSRDLRDLTNSFATPAPGEVLTTPAQASFTPDGQRFVLSVKGGPDGGPFPSGRMAVFPVDNDGLLGVPVVTQFSVAEDRGGPFSFTFVDSETIIVVHANSQTVASYTIGSDNSLTLLSGPFDTGGFAPCWLDGTDRFVYTASFGGIPALGTSPDGDGVLNGFRVRQNGTLVPLGIGVSYPAPGPRRSGNHAIDVRVVGRFLYFLQPRLGMVGRLTIERNGTLVGLTNFGGLSPGVEPFVGLNPGINDFLARCFLQNPAALSPECLRGSIQGIAGF